MLKSKLLGILISLWLAIFLSACAGTTQVAFEPAEEQKLDTAIKVEDPPSEWATEEPEPKPYETDIAGTAEELYGTDPGSLTDVDYINAAEENPMLRYTVIYFDFNKSEIVADAREILSHHADFMKAHPAVRLRIEGHADQRGTSGYNLALGESRANAARTLMVAYGVDGSRISIISYGEEQPAVEGNTEEAFRLNRRAELIYP